MKRSIKYTILTIFCLAMIIVASAQSYDKTGYVEASGDISGKNNDNKFIVSAGKTWTGSISHSGNRTLYLIIEGTATISWLDDSMNGRRLEVILGTGGTLTNPGKLNDKDGNYLLTNYSNSLVLGQIKGKVLNYGTITSNGTNPIQPYSTESGSEGILENHGTINVSGNPGIRVGKTFLNYGTVTATGEIAVDTGSTLENSGTISTEGNVRAGGILRNDGTINAVDLKIESDATLYNNCKISLTGDFNCQKYLYMGEGAFIRVNGKTTFDTTNTCFFGANAILKTYAFTNRGAVNGPSSGGYGLVQYFTPINKWDFTPFGSNMYMVDGNGIDYTTKQPISFSVPATDCSEGFSLIEDSDGDGILDEDDEFPDDAERAFTAHYLGETSWKTLMFEDLWPDKGDYDFNDLVIKYKFTFHLNAQNEYVGLESQFQVAACGASYANGFGFQLNIPNASVTNVTGYVHTAGSSIALNPNKTEQGSGSEAVIIVYDNINASVGNMFNVSRTGTPKTVEPITVYVSLNKIIPDPDAPIIINPFIYINQIRDREVHLMNMPPTSKADPSYFGTGDDQSNGTTTFYRSSDGLPWALNVPRDVSHMLERIDFCVGYPEFKTWAESGGAYAETWYSEGIYDPVLY